MSNKGSRGELEVVRLLSEWWGPVEPEVKFVRTPRSGGWTHAESFRCRGDVMTSPGSVFPFSVEVKRREAWSMDRLLAGGASPVWGWWRQCVRAADDDQAQPLLWCRRNRQSWLVLVPRRLVVAGAELHTPDVRWHPSVSVSRDVRPLPVGYHAETFLDSSPLVWLEAARLVV